MPHNIGKTQEFRGVLGVILKHCFIFSVPSSVTQSNKIREKVLNFSTSNTNTFLMEEQFI